MSICDSACDTVKDYLNQVVVCLYNQPIVKDVVTKLFIMYDDYCESLTEETEEEEIDLDDLLAEFSED